MTRAEDIETRTRRGRARARGERLWRLEQQQQQHQHQQCDEPAGEQHGRELVGHVGHVEQPATSSSSSASSSLSIAADPSGALKFTKASLTAKAGTVTISFTNSSPLSHNLTIQQGTSGPVVGATTTFMGGTKTLTLKLKAGTYTFYCSVPGHRAAGMQGTLTVQ